MGGALMKFLQCHFDTFNKNVIRSLHCMQCYGTLNFQIVLGNKLIMLTTWRTELVTGQMLTFYFEEKYVQWKIIAINILELLDYTCRSTVYLNSKIVAFGCTNNLAELISGQNINSNLEPYGGIVRPQHKWFNNNRYILTLMYIYLYI